ncbi:helix-turn-helix transcriptional regulator [bacterium]|nr:helix-turn-helix transcriptional regulator [bacterium]
MTIDVDNLPKIFGKKIKIERIKQEISQEKLAELAGLHRTTMGLIEKGKCFPELDTVAKIANGLNLELNELFDFTGI